MKKPKNFRAFTAKANGRVRDLKTPCHACAAFDPAVVTEPNRPNYVEFTAIWDTGATGCMVTQQVVDQCGLTAMGVTQVHGVHGVQQAPQFLVNFGLPNGVGVIGIKVTLGELTPDVQILIGMDVITRGDFSITNVGGQTWFSFRIPSLTRIDYVREHQKVIGPPSPGGNPPRNYGRNKKRRR